MKKGLLLTCLLTLIAAFGMAQSQWPITITRADGLPGTKGPLNYTFKTPQYSFEEAFQTLRFTVCSTTRIEPNTTSYDGFSSGWGPGNAFFELGELTVLDANGCSYKMPVGTDEEIAKLDASYAHLCKMRDELVTLNIVPAIEEWSSINPNL